MNLWPIFSPSTLRSLSTTCPSCLRALRFVDQKNLRPNLRKDFRGGALVGCSSHEKEKNLNDLNAIKKEFLLSIMGEEVGESPFHMDYKLRTVFFSNDVISLFGAISVYDHLPHGWERYEGRTFCKIEGRFKEVKLDDLFPEPGQIEFLRKYCEESLKSQPGSYFSGSQPLRATLDVDDISNFVIDGKFLIIFFQPYRVAGLGDGPWQVKIPYEDLKREWGESKTILDGNRVFW
jgi:hypothetical protein